VPERRLVEGVTRAGFRLRRAALGDSLPSVSVWIAGDPATGLPRWLTAYSEDDSLRIEFRGLRVLGSAREEDLELRVPSGTREQPLDSETCSLEESVDGRGSADSFAA
jgi:hypothetical protein